MKHTQAEVAQWAKAVLESPYWDDVVEDITLAYVDRIVADAKAGKRDLIIFSSAQMSVLEDVVMTIRMFAGSDPRRPSGVTDGD